MDAESLDDQVRRADPDRWLASRFVANQSVRADLIALYAFDRELSHALEATHEAMMAEIRLTWWREAVEQIFDGRPPRAHPVLQALAEAIRRRKLAAEPFMAMVEARFADIDAAALQDEATLAAYADGLCGGPLSLALATLGYGDSAALRPAALAWALERLSHEPERLPDGWTPDEALKRGEAAFAEAQPAAAQLPPAAFPAVAHLALLKPRLKGRSPGPLETRARLTLAVLTGRI